MKRDARVWGLDIAEGAWALVELERVAGTVRIVRHALRTYDDPTPLPGDVELVVVDIPIGLLDDAVAKDTHKGKSGDRPVDKGARRWCHSTSAVFPPPTRLQYASGLAEHARAARGGTKDERKRRLANVDPGGLSAQALELMPAIRSAAMLQAKHPGRVFEAHPETVFTALAGGRLPRSKKTLGGGLARLALLQRRLGQPNLGPTLLDWVEAPTDDWLDALSMAVVALDWTDVDARRLLKTADGRVHDWSGETDGVMAMPRATPDLPPARLTKGQFADFVRTVLRG